MERETFQAAAPICNYRLTSVCNHRPTWKAFQVDNGVLQCGGGKPLPCLANEPLQVLQDRTEKGWYGIQGVLAAVSLLARAQH
jgi:hypothetical protein